MRISSRFFSALFLFAFTLLVISSFPAHAEGPEKMTPLLLTVQDAPVSFHGSDGRIHLVY